VSEKEREEERREEQEVRRGDPKGWSEVLVTALGSVLGKPVTRDHSERWILKKP
jgi:hypothetical protein